MLEFLGNTGNIAGLIMVFISFQVITNQFSTQQIIFLCTLPLKRLFNKSLSAKKIEKILPEYEAYLDLHHNPQKKIMRIMVELFRITLFSLIFAGFLMYLSYQTASDIASLLKINDIYTSLYMSFIFGSCFIWHAIVSTLKRLAPLNHFAEYQEFTFLTLYQYLDHEKTKYALIDNIKKPIQHVKEIEAALAQADKQAKKDDKWDIIYKKLFDHKKFYRIQKDTYYPSDDCVFTNITNILEEIKKINLQIEKK